MTITAPEAANTLVGMCSHDGRIDMETVKGLIAISTQAAAMLEICGTSHVGLARNQIAARFMRSPDVFQWLVLVDSDIGFSALDFECLKKHWDKRVVIAPYPKKTSEFLMNPNNEGNFITYGMGFCMVHRSVFLQILDKMPIRCLLSGHLENDFFPSGVIGKDVDGHPHYVGEDVGFWSLCDMVGFPPFLVKDTNLRHVGRYIFGR